MPFVPLRFSNRLGFAMLEVQRIADATLPAATTTFYFNAHPQRTVNFFGGFFVKVPDTSGATGTNTVEFATEGVPSSNLPLYNYDGSQATVDDITTTGGVLLCFYDRTNNRLQLVNAF